MSVALPPAVTRAADAAASDHNGIVGYRIVQRSAIDGGPIHRRDEVELAAAFDGPTLLKIRVIRHVQNGSISSDVDNAKLATQLQQGSASGGFAVPFDRRHLSEYVYVANGGNVRFTSIRQDANHGNGEFSVDSGGHVFEMTYAPSRLPQYAKRGTVTLQRGEVLPGFWATLHQTQTYTGSFGFIHGAAVVNVDQSHFRHFADQVAALAALAAGTI
ncbi:MAG: hypothetical protein M3Y18_07560 [Candidatus Eremiobacteraeota bacterium]|nr:hypothetical protein [Candidatus Eremiobacteraeota bacterium]